MNDVLTAAQMRAIEEAAIASKDVTGRTLMERAGRGVVEAIFETWPALAASQSVDPRASTQAMGIVQDVAEFEYLDPKEGPCRAVVLCGPGNNGGDGFVVARLLRSLGWDVAVFLYGDAEKLPPDARANYERWLEMGEVWPLSEATGIDDLNRFADVTTQMAPHLVVDALFGTGLKRPTTHFVDDLFDAGIEGRIWPCGQRFCVLSVDAPSGLCLDSGRVLGEEDKLRADRAWAHAADLTVTFHRAKIGHLIADGPRHCGALLVKDIGL